MAFITDANARRIIRRTEIKDLNLTGDVFTMPIYILSNYEKQQLLAYKQFVKDTVKFLRETYKPIELKPDTYTLVYEYEKERPAYHKYRGCARLNQDYQNFTIPDEIRYKENRQLDLKRIAEFRRWFPTVENLFKYDKEAFVMRLQAKYGIITNPNALEALNSGPMELQNYELSELVSEIKQILQQAGRYYNVSVKNKTILKRFGPLSFLGYSDRLIYGNDTGYSDTEVKDFLREYDKEYKRPLKKFLREYYRVKYNPDMEFNGELMERLNFKPCSFCYKDGDRTLEELNPDKGQFLERNSEIENQEQEDYNKYMQSFYKLMDNNR